MNALTRPSEDRTIVLVGAALLGLLALTFGAAHLDLGGAGNLVVAFAIALGKAALVGWFFMELRERSRLVVLALGSAIFMLAIATILTLTDYLHR